MAGDPPLPPPRPAELTAPAMKNKPPVQAPSEGAASTCFAKLIASGAAAETAPEPATSIEGCGIATPVRLSSITVMNGDVVSLADHPLLECEFATVLADYVRLIVAPLGQEMLHATVASIETGPGYQCRTQDHIPGAKISAHAKGIAVDFMSITLADKRRVFVERQGAGRSVLFSRVPNRRLRLVHDRFGSRLRRVSREQPSSRHRTAWLECELPHLPVNTHVAYCATPLPKDQFSLLTSTRLMKTSSRRKLSLAARRWAMAFVESLFLLHRLAFVRCVPAASFIVPVVKPSKIKRPLWALDLRAHRRSSLHCVGFFQLPADFAWLVLGGVNVEIHHAGRQVLSLGVGQGRGALHRAIERGLKRHFDWRWLASGGRPVKMGGDCRSSQAGIIHGPVELLGAGVEVGGQSSGALGIRCRRLGCAGQRRLVADCFRIGRDKAAICAATNSAAP